MRPANPPPATCHPPRKAARRLALVLLLGTAAAAPQDIDVREVAIVSEGTRMSGQAYSLKSSAGKKLPCILMAHGWGGTAAALRPEALFFAKSGYFVAAFDYRGWGKSESRVILTQPAPSERPGGKFTAEVREVREVVDPIDMGIDWLNAIDWAAGEPQCDVNRLGLWGSSFSGGLVVYAAERDSRVKAIHSQVGAMDGRSMIQTAGELAKTRDEATKFARGETGYPAPGAVVIGNLRGAPIRRKFGIYEPVEELDRAPNCAMEFVIAEKEELFDNKDHALKAMPNVKGPKRLITIPGITHYGIYFNQAARKQSNDLALEWFERYLKENRENQNRQNR
jgi:dienelactone hydrolase